MTDQKRSDAPRLRLQAAFDACPDPYVHNYMKAFGEKYLDAVDTVSENKHIPDFDSIAPDRTLKDELESLRDWIDEMRDEGHPDNYRKRTPWMNLVNEAIAHIEKKDAELADLKHDIERYVAENTRLINEAPPSATEALTLGHAPKTERNTFTIPNPFPHDPKKNPTIDVVYASFAACIERENNGLRAPEDSQPVAIYMGRRVAPEGTREIWGYLHKGVESLPEGSNLYAAPRSAWRDLTAAESKVIPDFDSIAGPQPAYAVPEERDTHNYCEACGYVESHDPNCPEYLTAGMTAPKASKPRFANVSCSHCGQLFGPGDAGFSHCEDHKGRRSLGR